MGKFIPTCVSSDPLRRRHQDQINLQKKGGGVEGQMPVKENGEGAGES